MSVYEQADEGLYENVKHGILMASEPFGFETFSYPSAAERDDGLATLRAKIEELADQIERHLALINDGEIEHLWTWDGEDWEKASAPQL